jgi:hypothetical protein
MLSRKMVDINTLTDLTDLTASCSRVESTNAAQPTLMRGGSARTGKGGAAELPAARYAHGRRRESGSS